ncbi:ABC-2 transporter permease [Clostridium oceanicum]|uniref:ABC-2 family transporter protein n=1 Tax=Clostridium oceanicum TaxID=1543 RepID=A0ABN1JUX7_9CLOT
MFNLLKKDFIISKIYIIICLGIGMAITGSVILLNPNKYRVYIYVVGYTSIMYIFFCNFIDFRYKGNFIIRSLPINKDEVVISKYIQVLIVVLITYILNIILCVALKFLFNVENISILGGLINFRYIAICFSICMILMAVYYPICFKLNTNKCRAITQISYIIIGISPNIYIDRRVIIENFFNNNWLLFFIISIVFFIVSIKISINLYRIKDCY